MKAVHAAGRNWSADNENGIQLNEWTKEGWTYHAKGICAFLDLKGSIEIIYAHSFNLSKAYGYLLPRSHHLF